MKREAIIALIGIILISGCVQQQQSKETPSQDIRALEVRPGEIEFSKVMENPSAYDNQGVVFTGQIFSIQGPMLLVNGKSGVNLEGITEGLKSGFYTLEGIYDSKTNTLKVEKTMEFKIDCNTPITIGQNVVKDLVCVRVEGLIASPPMEILDELNAFIPIPNTPTEGLKIYPYVVFNKDGIYLVLSDTLSILPTEFTMEYGGKTSHLYFSSGEVQGTLVKTKIDDIKARFSEKLGERGFDPKEFKGIIIASSIKPLDPIRKTVKEVNNNPSDYAFKRIEIDASYIVTTARIDYGKGEESVKVPMGLGVLADKFADFYEKDRKLRLEAIDPEGKVWQFRKAKIIGTILYPTEEVLKYFDYSAPSTKQQVKDEIKPALIVDTLVDDIAQVSDISELNRLTGKPSKYWNRVVEFEGYVLGVNVPIVKYAEEALGAEIPVEVNIMAVGIADPKEIKTRLDLQNRIPAIATIGLNNELINQTEVIAGKYRFKVAVSPMPQELINLEKLRGFGTAFFLLEKKLLASPEQLAGNITTTQPLMTTLPPLTAPPTTTPTIPPMTTPPPTTKDTDGDGIPDESDKCPLLPENFNGYQDDDGCPDVKPAFP